MSVPHKRLKTLHISSFSDTKMKRKSLLYAEIDTRSFLFMNTSKQPTLNGKSVKRTNICRVGAAIGSVFLDMTDNTQDKIQVLQAIARQYPSRIGVLTHIFGDMRVAEINFDIEDPAHKSILEKGVVFADETIIIPCRACEQGSLAVHLELSNLPFTTEKNLSDGLCKSLSSYGDMLDVGTLVEATSDTYMCTGYAILDRSRRSGQFKPLTHAIPWTGGGTKNHFYVVWNDMGNYCPCCHSEDHTLDACPKADDDTVIISDHAMSENGLPEYVEYARQKTREYINLVVTSEWDVTTTIKLKRVTPLYKLMHAYCKQCQKSPLDVCFLYHGQVLVHDKTPEDMHMEEGDTIYFVDNQRRGA